MIATDLLRSPCCGVELNAPTREALACGRCAAPFPVRAFGPDLMPPDSERRYDAYPQWQAVQDALTAWRRRTWTGTPDAAARTQRAVQLAEAFVAWVGIAGTVLDIGCGGGWLRRMMPAVRYHGIDPMPADQEYLFPFVRGISDRLPFADRVFDACCFFSSIDYAINIDTTIAEAWRVLKPGGTLAIASMIHGTKEVDGERLHHYRYLAGELDALVARAFVDVSVLVYQPGYHFIQGRKEHSR
ncbi:MAG: hypothetical protein A3G25_11455 [Betaproteobacteria bacterium RIFCSPLOWO2_12_FULL_63_13]|nr:MAG: hypothetical protein A3G25_11455 [Betaproteobacteria bacterium RIFCSPLOWO2_12_FULL_63_13]